MRDGLSLQLSSRASRSNMQRAQRWRSSSLSFLPSLLFSPSEKEILLLQPGSLRFQEVHLLRIQFWVLSDSLCIQLQLKR